MRKSCLLFCIVFAKKVFLENWRINYAKKLFFVFVFKKISDYCKNTSRKTERKYVKKISPRPCVPPCVRARRRVERASEREKKKILRAGGAGRGAEDSESQSSERAVSERT
jgi:hypothetical protein